MARRTFERAFAVATWFSIALAALAVVAIASRGTSMLAHPLKGDFGVFYAAGRMAAAGAGGTVYSLAAIDHQLRSLGAQPMHLIYPYPPYVTMLLRVFALFPPGPALAVWTVLNVGAYALGGVLVARAFNSPLSVRAWLVFAISVPLAVSVFQGENGGLSALGLALVLTSMASKSLHRPRILALAAGVAILAFKPQFLIVPLIVLLFRRRPQELIVTGVSLASLFLLGLTEGGFPGYQRFVDSLLAGLHAGIKYHWGPPFNYTLESQAQSVFGHTSMATGVWVVGALVVVAIMLVVCSDRFVRAPDDAGSQTLSVSLTIALATILTSTHAMYHDLGLLYPFLAVAVAARAFRWPATFCLAAIVADPILWPMVHVHVLVWAFVLMLAVLAREPVERALRTIEGCTRGDAPASLWKLFAPPRWGSVSESETP